LKRDTVNELLQVLYPDDIKCIVCGREIHKNRYGLCESCRLPLNDNFCVRCGRHKVGTGDYCGECGNMSLHFDEARSSVCYDGAAKSIVHRFKYGDARYLAHVLSEYLLDTLIATDWSFDCFTFVPLHPSRFKKRGYNQAELLATALAERTTTPCIPLLEKTVKTINQARLEREERIKNVVGSFSSYTKPPESVVIIDDVMTTGATLDECAKVLKKNGAVKVYGLTFASVPEKPLRDTQGANIREFRR